MTFSVGLRHWAFEGCKASPPSGGDCALEGRQMDRGREGGGSDAQGTEVIE